MTESKPDTDLLPCPFCGGEAEFAGYAHEPDCYVYCGNDNCFGPRTTAGNLHDAAIQWNTRAAVRAQRPSLTVERSLVAYNAASEEVVRIVLTPEQFAALAETIPHEPDHDDPQKICAYALDNLDCYIETTAAEAERPAVPPHDSASPAEPLIQKWRRAALAIEAHALELETREEEGMSRAQADTLNDCADDLFKALFRSQEVTTQKSWYCDPCAVEVYQFRCPHCGKTKREKR